MSFSFHFSVPVSGRSSRWLQSRYILPVFVAFFGWCLVNQLQINEELKERALAPAAWPTVDGRIEACHVDKRERRNGTMWIVAVRYAYQVAGVAYHSERLAYGYEATRAPEVHQALADRLNAAQVVAVRYDPTRPEDSVLSYGVPRELVNELTSGKIALVASVCMLAFTLWLFFSGTDAALTFESESEAIE